MSQTGGRKTNKTPKKKKQQILVVEDELCPSCGEHTLTMKTKDGVLIYENCKSCGYGWSQ